MKTHANVKLEISMNSSLQIKLPNRWSESGWLYPPRSWHPIPHQEGRALSVRAPWNSMNTDMLQFSDRLQTHQPVKFRHATVNVLLQTERHCEVLRCRSGVDRAEPVQWFVPPSDVVTIPTAEIQATAPGETRHTLARVYFHLLHWRTALHRASKRSAKRASSLQRWRRYLAIISWGAS